MSDDLVELNLLWEPVKPYLVRQIEELHGRREGNVLEIGPFSGLVLELAARGTGSSFLLAVFPPRLVEFYRREAERQNVAGRVRVIESDSDLTGVSEESIDIAVFRGALFFPSFFTTNFRAIYSRLRPGGRAFVGGGFGKYTPPEVIERIGERSRELNLSVGKVRITGEDVRGQLRAADLEDRATILTEGGLWVVMEKGKDER